MPWLRFNGVPHQDWCSIFAGHTCDCKTPARAAEDDAMTEAVRQVAEEVNDPVVDQT